MDLTDAPDTLEREGVWARLRRRKVVQWGLAYAAGADEPEFKAIFADIERDMARQRAELAKRPKDAPLNLDPRSAAHQDAGSVP
jgi:hypothetical protein